MEIAGEEGPEWRKLHASRAFELLPLGRPASFSQSLSVPSSSLIMATGAAPEIAKGKSKLVGRVSFAPQGSPSHEREPLLNDDVEAGNEEDEDGTGSASRLHRKSKIGLLLGGGKRSPFGNLREGERTGLRRWRYIYGIGWALVVLVVIGVIVGATILDPGDHPTGPSPPPPPPGGSKPTGTSFTLPAPPPTGLPRNPAFLIKAEHGAVATEHEDCSDIGVELLKQGGSAVDAAIGGALCVGTLNMFASGIGGGGFMTIRPRSGEAITVDFREVAPLAANKTMFGKDPFSSLFGGMAVGVPGELRGYEEAHRRFGRLPWATVLAPAIKLAAGFKLGKETDRRLKSWGQFMFDAPEWASIFAPQGRFLTTGEWTYRTNYSRTLQRVADEGADVFYYGEIAESLVRTINKAGGIMTLEDFAVYKPNVYNSLTGSYRGNKIYTSGPPTSGAVVLHILNMLERFDFPSEGRTGLNTHRLVEALKFGFGARTEMGDTAFTDNAARIQEISTKEYSRQISAKIDDERTHTAEFYGPVFDIPLDHGTTHISVVDDNEMAVGITTTVNLIWGSRVLDPDTGVILNDEMDDFSRPDMPNFFGMPPSPYNYPEPGKRSVSSTCPTVIERPDGSFLMVVGGSGGTRIFPAAVQTIVGALDWGWDISTAIEHPRVHDQLFPAEVSIESGFEAELVDALRSRGHNISIFDINEGRAEIQSVLSGDDGYLYAASDSRKNGVASGY